MSIPPQRSRAGMLPSIGVMLMVASVLLAPLIDVFSKLAVAELPAMEVTAARFVFQSLFVLPFAWMRGPLVSRSMSRTGLHMLRGLMIVLGMTCFTLALRAMPIPDAIAIFFIEPALLTLMSGVFLREHISSNKIIACAAGFCGSLLVIQPSFAALGWVSLLPVVTAFTVAGFVLLTRIATRDEDPWTTQFQSSLWALILSALLLALANAAVLPIEPPRMPTGQVLVFLAGLGLSATVAGILSIYAYRATPASVLAPLQYFEIVTASIVSYWIFGDFPDLLTWIGIVMIIGSGLFIIWREDDKSPPQV